MILGIRKLSIEVHLYLFECYNFKVLLVFQGFDSKELFVILKFSNLAFKNSNNIHYVNSLATTNLQIFVYFKTEVIFSKELHQNFRKLGLH